MESIAVIGLGYVGLSLAQQAASAGFLVYGIDTNKKLLSELALEATYFTGLSTELPKAQNLNVTIVCVPTPITKYKQPDLKYINNALTSTGKVLRKGQLVIIESTVFPRYCEDIGKTILEEVSGLVTGEDFYLAHCPERVNPGDETWNIANIPRVIGGINDISTKLAVKFYTKITSGQLHLVSNIAEAEASKMIENSFRDINIAFVNELARSFDGTGVNIHHVLKACATKPFGYMPFTPNMGVGGHCIPVDPYYLITSAKSRNFTHSLLQLARETNDAMVDYVYEKINERVRIGGLTSPRVGIFGLAYKPNVPDVRESQSIRLAELLRSKGISVKTHDPLLKSEAESEDDLFEWANIVVLAVHHDAYLSFEDKINSSRNITAVVDVVNMIDADKLQRAVYQGIGI